MPSGRTHTIDFGVWTLTTALFNTQGNEKAAKGWPLRTSLVSALGVQALMSRRSSDNPLHFHILLLLRHRLHPDARSLHPGNSSIQYPRKGLCGDGACAVHPTAVTYAFRLVGLTNDCGLPSQNFVVSLTLAFNQFVNPWALAALGWYYVRTKSN